MSNFVPILAYHKIQPDFDYSITYVTPNRFETHVAYLSKAGYRTVSIKDYIKNPMPDTKQVIITFDDAYECVFKHAFPILNQYGLTATIFPITEFIGGDNKWDYNSFRRGSSHCTWDQLKILLAAGWEIGSHTVTHPNLCALSDEALWSELWTSKELLEKGIKSSVDIVSYPFGKYNSRVTSMAAKVGYAGGCTLGYNYPHTQEFPFALFRRGVYCFEPLNIFKLKLKNGKSSRCDDIKQRIITFLAQGSLLLRYIRSLQKSLD